MRYTFYIDIACHNFGVHYKIDLLRGSIPWELRTKEGKFEWQMTKDNFKKGQTVYIYLTGNAARGKKDLESCIEEHEVISVGRKYITTKSKLCSWKIIKFDMENDFREVTEYTRNYVLYLSKADIEHDLWRSQTERYINNMLRWDKRTLSKMSDEDLKAMQDILKKYE